MKQSSDNLGRFTIKGLLQEGRRATSYLASHAGKGRRPSSVLKLLESDPHPEHPRSPRELLREDMPELVSVAHPSLSLPHDFGIDGATGCAYFVRSYTEGSDLLTATRTMSMKRQLSWFVAAAEALSLLHRAGFVHGALKPANLMVPRAALFSRRPRGPRVVLCDPAWWIDESAEPRAEVEEESAPELAEGAGRSFATDLYALGAVFYRALAHRSLNVGESGFPEPPSDANPRVPVNLSRAVMKLLHPDPRRRYRDADELLEDLSRLAGGREPSAASLGAGPVPECFFGRHGELRRIVRPLTENESPEAFAVAGEAGMGKSSFLRRLGLEVQLEGHQTVLVHCHSETSARSRPLEAIAERLIPAGAPGRSLRSRFRALVNETPEVDRAAGTDPRSRRVLIRRWLDLVGDACRAVRTVLLVDDVHLADSLTIDVLSELVRRINRARSPGEKRSGPQATPDLVVSFGAESPFTSVLAPLVQALDGSSADRPTVELSTLERDAVDRWLDLAASGRPQLKESILSAPRIEGHPFAIRETLQIGRSVKVGHALDEHRKLDDLSSIHDDFLASKDAEQRSLLETLAVLGRPASADLLRRLLDSAQSEVELALDSLLREGTLRDDRGACFFQHSSFHQWLVGVMTPERRRALHGRIASHLETSSTGSVEEIAHHWLRSDEPKRGVPSAIAAARLLAERHEHQRALDFYRVLPELLAARDFDLRRAVLEETADSYSRVGQHPRAVEILRDLLRAASDPLEKGRLHGRVGVYSHRFGDVNTATTHLEEALRCLAEAQGVEALRERLVIESELAEIASNKGDYQAASRICRRALQSVERSPDREDREVRRAEMVLVETLAHLKLRRFEYDTARELFENSLRISEDVDAVAERSLILNNLGILHNQENRFPQAIDCYRSAARLSRELGDDIVLVNIESNLALLHAKCGDFEAADSAIGRAVDHESRCDSARTRFMRLHCAGLVDLLSGRYASGIETLESAISLGEELKDKFLIAFDLVYLGECHLYRGEAKAAAAAFERALSVGSPSPAPVASMVAARRAVGAALRGEVREARAMLTRYEDGASEGLEYLEAWNRVFAGWAARRLGEWDRAAGWLGGARTTFRRIKARAGELHAALELAALEMDRGKVPRAAKRLERLRRHSTPGKGPLKNPMLAARLLIALTRLELEGNGPDLQEASSLLVEAESYLIGRRLRDLEASVRDLRRRLQQLTLERTKSASFSIPPLRGSGLSGLSDDVVRGLRGAARDLFRSFEDELGKERAATVEKSLREFEQHIEELRRAAEGEPEDPGVRADSILGRSSAIREVVRLVRQLAPSALPILITGETGTGKELVARAIHGESAGAESGRVGPFVSVNCAALPEELLEAELFGYEQGAFSGAETDRPGLLRSAAGGTVLFDEIGETSLGLQGKLLRVLDRGRVRSIGSAEESEIGARFLFTTNRDLRALVDAGEFRQDLFFRLSSLEITVPPLRERLDDLPLLVEFVRQSSGREDAPRFSEDAVRALAQHPWPGNVRELENVVTRLVLGESDLIRREDVQTVLGRPSTSGFFAPAFLRSRPLDQLVAQLEREYLVQFHADAGGDMKAMAASLGISLQALYKRFKALGVRPRDLR